MVTTQNAKENFGCNFGRIFGVPGLGLGGKAKRVREGQPKPDGVSVDVDGPEVLVKELSPGFSVVVRTAFWVRSAVGGHPSEGAG